jgi:acetylornithine deacetylase/succinyl-diaminopimelate desuccinylase-like protein
LDTVFPIGTDLSLQRDEGSVRGPGIGDNALAVAALFGLQWQVRREALDLPFDLWLCANVCEEGLGNLRGMRAVVERFGAAVQAYLVLEGLGLGHVYHRGLGVHRYRITTRTEGGHAWLDHGQPSAVHELARLATHLTRLEVPRVPRSSLNIGIFNGGTSINTIASDASLEVDLRSEDPQTLAQLAERVEGVCKGSRRRGVEVEAEVIGERPAGGIPAQHPLVELCTTCLRQEGLEPKLTIGSTDANLPLSLGFPAVTLSLTTGGRAHTVHEYIDIEPLRKGLSVLFGIVKSLALKG